MWGQWSRLESERHQFLEVWVERQETEDANEEENVEAHDADRGGVCLSKSGFCMNAAWAFVLLVVETASLYIGGYLVSNLFEWY